jgi:hypothetical protein
MPIKMLRLPAEIRRKNGRIFRTRYKEHVQAIRNSHTNYGYSNHILNIGHKYGTMTDIMDIIRTHRKGKYLNTSEKYHIYKINEDNFANE